MGFIPTITCRKCGRHYSGIRSRCPNCGAKHVKQSSRTPVTTDSARPGTSANSRAAVNTRWQMIFSVILLVAVIAAVIVLIASSLNGNDDSDADVTPSSDVVETTPIPTTPPTPSPSPTPEITSITISFFSETRTEFAMNVGDQVPLTATAYPVSVNAEITWRSTDEDICLVDEDGVVTGVASGWASVIAESGGVSQECKVWVR
jgi:predicted  nucleic acid-binding Zn-ribbon protein